LGFKEMVVLPLAKRWIAGVDMQSAMEDAKNANSRGIGAIVNFLGEDIKDKATADAQAAEYLRLQQSMSEAGVNGFVSVKLTQLGLGADDEGMRVRLERIAANADRLRQLLWIDMEGSSFTEVTVQTYIALHQMHTATGVALQA